MENTTTDTAAFPDAIQDQTIETTPAKSLPYMRKVEVEISDAEKLERHERHLKLELQIDAVKAERASEMADYNGRLKELRERRGELINAIHTGRELQDVACYDVADERLGKVTTHAADDDRVIDERPMTIEERQGQLPFAPRDGGADESDGDFEPTPEALAQAAEDEGRVVKTNSKEAKRKAKARKGEVAAEEPAE